MNERRFRQLNILTIIAVAVGIGMMLFFAFVVSDGGNQKISFRTPKKLDDTWVLYRQGETDEQIIDHADEAQGEKRRDHHDHTSDARGCRRGQRDLFLHRVS